MKHTVSIYWSSSMRRSDLRGTGGALGLLTTEYTSPDSCGDTSLISSFSLFFLFFLSTCAYSWSGSGGGLSSFFFLFFFLSTCAYSWSGSWGGLSSFFFFLSTCAYSWSGSWGEVSSSFFFFFFFPLEHIIQNQKPLLVGQ